MITEIMFPSPRGVELHKPREIRAHAYFYRVSVPSRG